MVTRPRQAKVVKPRQAKSPALKAVDALVAKVRRDAPERSNLFESRVALARALAVRLGDATVPIAPVARELTAVLDLIAGELVDDDGAVDADMP